MAFQDTEFAVSPAGSIHAITCLTGLLFEVTVWPVCVSSALIRYSASIAGAVKSISPAITSILTDYLGQSQGC